MAIPARSARLGLLAGLALGFWVAAPPAASAPRVWSRIGIEINDNIYGTEFDAESDWAQAATVGVEYRGPSANAVDVFLDGRVRTRAYNRFRDEDETAVELKAEASTELAPGTRVRLHGGYERIWADESAYAAYAAEEWELRGRVRHDLGRGGAALAVGAVAAELRCRDHPGSNSETSGLDAEAILPLGGLAEAVLSYSVREVDYPNRKRLDPDYQYKDRPRRDDASRFSAAAANIFSIRPMVYARVQVVSETVSSNSTGIDFNAGRIIVGYDGQRTRSASVFGYRELGAGATASAYLYYRERTWPNRPALAEDGSNLDQSRRDELYYLFARYARPAGAGARLGLEYGLTVNRSNSRGRGYRRNLVSVFMETDFN